MPLQNVTIDDVSALIGYHNPNGIPWKDSPSNDPSLGSYSDQTYHSSNQTGAWSIFRFEGVAVYLFAATRRMHGRYDIFIDDQLVYQGNGHTKASIFHQLVFNATNLSAGWHSLTFVNTDPGLYIEVDYISWTTVMSAALTESSGAPIFHTPGNMTYDLSLWEGGQSSSSPYMVTRAKGAQVNITFKGNGIELYGRTGPDYGVFSSQVDNYDSHELDAYSGRVHNTMLFRQDNFPDGEHTLVVTNSGNASLAIISALPVIWSKDPGHAHGIHGGIIAAIVVGLSIGIAMLVFLWLWFTRRKYTYQGVHMEDYAGTPVAYMPAYESTPFVFPIAVPGRQAGAHSPRKYANEQYRGTGHSAQYHSSNTSPSSGSGGHWGYSPVASPASPNFNREASGFRPYSHDALPVVYGHIRPLGQGRKPTAPVSLSQIRPAGAPNLLRDSGANSTLLPPSYKAAIISHSRD